MMGRSVMKQTMEYRGCRVAVLAEAQENGRMLVSYRSEPLTEEAKAAYGKAKFGGVTTHHDIDPWPGGALTEGEAMAFGISSAKSEVDLLFSRNW
jgi:hypothetical protein